MLLVILFQLEKYLQIFPADCLVLVEVLMNGGKEAPELEQRVGHLGGREFFILMFEKWGSKDYM